MFMLNYAFSFGRLQPRPTVLVGPGRFRSLNQAKSNALIYYCVFVEMGIARRRISSAECGIIRSGNYMGEERRSKIIQVERFNYSRRNEINSSMRQNAETILFEG